VQLDGGGSSKMWITRMGYVNNEPQDRAPPVVIFARPNGQCPSDCGSAACVQLLRPFRAQCVGQACRAGLGNIWNCDQDQKERARCDNGVVTRECCAMGCMPQPNGQDDQCIGGTVPCPAGGDAGPDAGGASDAASGPPTDAAPGNDGASIDGASSQDSGVSFEDASPVPETDASAPNGAAQAGSSSGCGCRTTREGDSLSFTSIATVAAIAAHAFRRRRTKRR